MSVATLFATLVACAFALTAQTQAAEPGTAEYIEFAKREIEPGLAAAHIPGVVFAVVDRSGKTALWAAGFSDRERRVPMSAEQTVVRVASTSKLFTALAASDLAVQGKLDLDADVNHYLGEKFVPEAFGQPVTMRQLLTHTAGFDERYVGIVAKDVHAIEDLTGFLRTELPERVRPPGLVTSYSNHAVALAGLVLERITGQKFSSYIEQKIFKPLAMSSSSFELPAALQRRIAKAYEPVNGLFARAPLDRIRTLPASSLITTAADMVPFLKLQLGMGKVDGNQVFSEQSVSEMQRRQFGNSPGVAGFGLAFMEREVLGARVILHGGEARGVNTLFAIIPDAGVGFFLNYNRYGSDFAEKILLRFVDAFVPPSARKGEMAHLRAIGADLKTGAPPEIEGYYQSVRYPHSNFTKIGAFVGGFAKEYRVRMLDADMVELVPTLGFMFGEKPTRWKRSGPVSFEREDGGEAVVFKEGFLLVANRPEAGYEKVSKIRSLHVELSVAVLTMAAMLFLVVFALWRRKKNWKAVVSLVACWTELLFCGLFGIYLAVIPPIEFAYGVSTPFRVILVIGFLAGPLSLGRWVWLLISGTHLSRFQKIEAAVACMASTLFFLVTLDLNLVKAWS